MAFDNKPQHMQQLLFTNNVTARLVFDWQVS